MVPRAGVCVPRGSVAAAAGYAYGTGAGPGYGYAYGAGPGYGYSPVLTPGYASRPGPDYGYMAGPPHDLGGPVRNGNMCWSDKDAWGNTGQGRWKAC